MILNKTGFDNFFLCVMLKYVDFVKSPKIFYKNNQTSINRLNLCFNLKYYKHSKTQMTYIEDLMNIIMICGCSC